MAITRVYSTWVIGGAAIIAILLSCVRAEEAGNDRRQAIGKHRTMQARVADQIAFDDISLAITRVYSTWVIGGAAIIAILLSCVGKLAAAIQITRVIAITPIFSP
jgi:dihydrofolate reductase